MTSLTRVPGQRLQVWGGGGSGGGGGGAPTNATYITATANGVLSNEEVFGATVFYPPDILANRPAANATIVGAMYFATNGGGSAGQGILYRSDGVSTWEAIAIDKDYADALYQPLGSYQPLDATLTALAGLATGANQAPYSTGTDTFAQYAISSLGRAYAGMSRDTFSNADKSLSAGTRVLAQTGTMSAPRTVTLTAASAYTAGTWLLVTDESGTVSVTNTIIIARAGADTINGQTTYTISAPYGWVLLQSDGSSKWTTGSVTTGVNLQEFTATGANTWTKPANAIAVYALVIGAGAGGGGGGCFAVSVQRGGGGGGGAGGVNDAWFDAADLGSTVTATVGTGGNGGNGATADSTQGSAGSAGGSSTFGSISAAGGGGDLFTAGGGGGNNTGSASGGLGSIQTARGGRIAASALVCSSSGGAGGSTGVGANGEGSGPTSGGGAGGGGINAANPGTNAAGGTGGTTLNPTGVAGGTAGTAGGGNGGNGADGVGIGSMGTGGGGGGSSNASGTNGGTGGIGGQPGGGGGGGGGGTNTGAGGNGGRGGHGAIYVLTIIGRPA